MKSSSSGTDREQALVSSLPASPQESDGYPAEPKVCKPVLLPTISRLVDFRHRYDGIEGMPQKQKANRRVVYIPGVWDLFHIGHVRFLEQASKLGDYILVGVLSDADVNRRIGRNYPLQSVHERTLSLLACKYIDDVLIGAPWKITQDMITTMDISVVCRGSTDFWDRCGVDHVDQGDPFELPRDLNILKQVDSGCSVTVHDLADRIFRHAEEYVERQKKKETEEKRYVNGKAFVAES